MLAMETPAIIAIILVSASARGKFDDSVGQPTIGKIRSEIAGNLIGAAPF